MRSLFVTQLYEAEIADEAMLGELAHSIRTLAQDDAAGRYHRSQKRVGEVVLPNIGDELHHFGWNACSSALCPYAPHPHVERRYLIVPGIRSSRLHVIDTKPDGRSPKLVRVIEADELAARTGYSRPHTIRGGKSPKGDTET